MDIKVGEYVRTRTQGIKRIDTINENRPVNRYGYEIGSEWDGKLYSTIKTTDILKHSFNIIDLIEVGDYVNGLKITLINEPSISNCYKRIVYAEDENGYLIKSFSEDDIKSIVTKEKFESMEYKV